MVNEVLMVVKITIAMLGGNTFPVDIEMITTQEHCEQEIKNLRDTYKSQESELNELQVIMDEMNESRESMRNRILVCKEQGRGALLTIERLEREKSSNL